MCCPRPGEWTRSLYCGSRRGILCESRGGTASEAGYTKVNGGSVKENFRSSPLIVGFWRAIFGTKGHVRDQLLCPSSYTAPTYSGVNANGSKTCLMSN